MLMREKTVPCNGLLYHSQARVKTCHISDLNRLIVMVRNQRLGSRLFQVHFTCLRKVKKVSNSGTGQNAAKRSLGLSRNLFFRHERAQRL